MPSTLSGSRSNGPVRLLFSRPRMDATSEGRTRLGNTDSSALPDPRPFCAMDPRASSSTSPEGRVAVSLRPSRFIAQSAKRRGAGRSEGRRGEPQEARRQVERDGEAEAEGSWRRRRRRRRNRRRGGCGGPMYLLQKSEGCGGVVREGLSDANQDNLFHLDFSVLRSPCVTLRSLSGPISRTRLLAFCTMGNTSSDEDAGDMVEHDESTRSNTASSRRSSAPSRTANQTISAKASSVASRSKSSNTSRRSMVVVASSAASSIAASVKAATAAPGVALADLRKGLRTSEQASVEVLHKILNDTTGATDLLKISKEVDQAGRSGLFYAAWHNRNLCA